MEIRTARIGDETAIAEVHVRSWQLAERNTEATLWVLADNTRARRFYAANGWRPDGGERRDHVWGITADEVRYRRSLRGSAAASPPEEVGHG